MARLSVAVVAYNSENEILNVLKSVENNTKKTEYSLTVIDNASTDNTVNTVRSACPGVNIISAGENRGFGAGPNKMLGAHSVYHAVINPDITFEGDVLSGLCDYLDRNPDVAMVTPQILNPDGTVQNLPKRKPTKRYMILGRLSRYIGALKGIRDEYTRAGENITAPTEIEFCTGCFMVMRTELFNKVGGFDERFFMYLEDADLSDRIGQYGKIVYNPDFSVTHNWDGGSSKSFKLLKYHLKSMKMYFDKQNSR